MGSTCLHCASMLFAAPDPEQSSIRHYPTVGELVESAQTCHVCDGIQRYWSLGLLQQRFPELNGEESASLLLSLQVASWEQSQPNTLSWFVLLGMIRAKKHGFTASFKVTVTRQTLLGTEGESSWKHKLALIKSWYSECATSHPECVPCLGQYPERLIDVGDNGRMPRLISVTKDFDVKKAAAYATLSHCWGEAGPMRATTENVEQLSRGVLLDALPRTYREAILATRELGIPYLWIDSLCILQDDDDDKCRGIANMKHTYSCSAVTISALDAKDCTQGCFVDGNAEETTRQQAHTVLVHAGQQHVSVRFDGGDVEHPRKTAVLRTRAWTLQEEHLSHREVLCMRPAIRWKCQRVHRTEIGHEFPSRGLWTQCDPSSDLRHSWCDWMTDYSSRKLTFETDRLRALVGIMHYHGERTGHTHILVSWRETMIDDLLWLRGTEIVEPHAAMRSIPTWSWLTRARNVVFDFWTAALADYDSLSTIEDHSAVIQAGVSWDGEPMLSDIVATNLVVEGPVQQMRLRVDPRAMDFKPPYMRVGDEEPDFSSNPIPWRCAGLFDQEDVREDDNFTCLLMRSARVVGQGTMTVETFLMLVPEQGKFRRVGIAMLRSSETGFGDAIRTRISLV